MAEPLTQRDYEAIKNHLKTWRDLLILKFLRATGLRIAESLRVTAGDMREDGPLFYVFVRRGKTRAKTPKFEKVYLPPQLGVELRDFVRGNGIISSQPIFAVSARQYRRIVTEAGLKAIGRRVHPHELRHLYAKTLIDGGLPAEAAAKMLGHADHRTTEKYYYDLTSDQRAEIQRRIPV